MSNSAQKVLIVKNFKAPIKEGVHHRLLCMTGDNKGISYYLKAKRVTIGRGKTADIQINDVKSSREHVEIVKGTGGFIVTDLGSQNGTIVNELKVKQHKLKDGDKVIIGKTVFKYNKYNVEDEYLKKEKIKKVEEGDEDEEEDDGEKKPLNKKVLIGALAVLGLLFMFDTETPKKKKAKSNSASMEINENFSKAFNKKNDSEEDEEIKDTIAALLHSGQREYREGNYFRAIKEFERVLLLKSRHGRATFYISKAKQRLDDEIDQNLLKARREEEALKYQAALVSYCSIIRLLAGYADDERFVNADAKVKDLEKKLGYDEGEIKCLQQ